MLMPTWAPLVLRSQRVRGVTGRSLKPQRGGDGGAGVLPTGPGGAAGPWDPLLGQAPQGAGAEDSVFQELCSQLAQGQIQVLPLSYWVTLDKMPPGASVSLRVC